MSTPSITLTPLCAASIRSFLDDAIYGDASKNTSWSEMISAALLDKQAHRLSEFVSHGKGFNDTTKKAVCTLLGAPVVYTQKGMDALVAAYCGIPLETLLLERKLCHAKQAEERAHKALLDAFSNGSELVDWVQGLLAQGYTQLQMHNGKAYLATADGKNGYRLPRKAIRVYAQACTDTVALTARLALKRRVRPA